MKKPVHYASGFFFKLLMRILLYLFSSILHSKQPHATYSGIDE